MAKLDTVNPSCTACDAFKKIEGEQFKGQCKVYAPTPDTKGDPYNCEWPVVDGRKPCCREFRPKGMKQEE